MHDLIINCKSDSENVSIDPSVIGVSKGYPHNCNSAIGTRLEDAGLHFASLCGVLCLCLVHYFCITGHLADRYQVHNK